MKLSDYINFRRRSKKGFSAYDIRTQHFYDGKPIVVDGRSYPGIKAEFMNNLEIPNATTIVHAQKLFFNNIKLTTQQSSLLSKLLTINFNDVNIAINNMVEIINEFEQSIDKIIEGKKQFSKQNNKPSDFLDNQLKIAYNLFLKIFESIQKKYPVIKTDSYVQQLQKYINTFNNQIKSNPTILFDKTKILKKDGTTTSFADQLTYLSYQIKGITLLEHRGIEFISNILKYIPEDIEIVSTGQIFVDGKYAHQDALFAPIKIKTKDGRSVSLSDYLKEINQKKEEKSIYISSDDWDYILQQCIALQSKYSRFGQIKMGEKISLKQIMSLNIMQAKALRNLYILSNQNDPDTNEALVSHKFNVRSTHKDYKALFSYCLYRFMNQILTQNYYMMTTYGIRDSFSYYNDLLNHSKYFQPQGTVNINDLDKEYSIHINEKF